jgi:hypothetical protein
MPTRPRRRRSARIAAQSVELALAAPQVMALRLAQLALAGSTPSLRDRKEMHRMGMEKLEAFYKSWNGMLFALLRANQDLAFSPFQFWWSSARARRTGLAMLAAGLAPIHSRATANARRLRRAHLA